MFVIIILIAIYFYLDKNKYDKSDYKKESGISYLQAKFNTGYYGEYLTYKRLEKIKGKHRILTNIYIPKEDNQTTEIDLIFIHATGIYVLESKNYSGWIFGNEKSRYWMQTFKTGKKEKFYNPIWQNNTHIKYLKKLLNDIDGKYYRSLIVFSERCTIKKMESYSDDVKVIKRYDLARVLNNSINISKAVLSEDEIEGIYNKIKPYTNVDESVKKQHIRNLNRSL